MLDAHKIKSEFPIFDDPQNAGLVYLDNAATTQKPQCVIDAIVNFYTKHNANIHRGLYPLAHRADSMYEAARTIVADYFNAQNSHGVIFCKGTTDGINLVAQSFVKQQLNKSSNIIVTQLEHHANFVPWQQLCIETGSQLRIAPVFQDGQLDMDRFESLIDSNTQFIAITHISNALGSIVDMSKIKTLADVNGITLLIDGAQSAASMQVNLSEIDPDFYVFSGHKTFGPTGIGAVLVSKRHTANMSPYQYGGDMIKSVSLEKTSFADFPRRLEAGTPNVSGAIGLAESLRFIIGIGRSEIHDHVVNLRRMAFEKLSELDDMSIIGGKTDSSSIISFVLNDIHPHDVATLLAEQGVAVRAGHHCTQPLLKALGQYATVRASFSIYNSIDDVDKLVEAIKHVQKFFKG